MIFSDSKNGLITNVDIYGLERSKKTCQYPMNLKEYKDIKDNGRLEKLASAKAGSGHDCALKGVVIRYDINAPAYFWQQWQRYHFSDIVSSQSKMHRILKMNIDEQCNKYVNDVAKNNLIDIINQYKQNPTDEMFQYVLSNTPMGLNLKADCVSNLLQEKSKYAQRRTHRLAEWQEYCDWVEDVFNYTGLKLK